MATHEVLGLTDAQKSQLKKQFEARLKSRAGTRGSSARRTGNKVEDVKGGVGLMPDKLRGKTRDKDVSMTSEMRKYVTDLGKRSETATSYADSVKKAYAGAETDHTKSRYYGGGGPVSGHKKHAFGSGKTGQKRADVRAWGENITAAYKKKYNIGTGKSTEADRSAYKQKQVDVDKRRRHLIGAPKKEYS